MTIESRVTPLRSDTGTGIDGLLPGGGYEHEVTENGSLRLD